MSVYWFLGLFFLLCIAFCIALLVLEVKKRKGVGKYSDTQYTSRLSMRLAVAFGVVTVALILIFAFVPYQGMNMIDVLGHDGWLNLSNLMLLITMELLALNVVVGIKKYRASQRPGSKYSDPMVFKAYTRKMMNLLYLVIALTIGVYCLLKYVVL